MKYLVAVDGSDHAEDAFRFALTLIHKETDELHIVSVIASSKFHELVAAHKDGQHILGEHEEKIWGVVARCQATAAAANIKVFGDVIKGDVRESLCKFAAETNIDIFVVGARGLGTVKRLVLGSVSSYVLSHSHCSVLIVKHAPREVSQRTFLVGYDESRSSDVALDVLLRLANKGDHVVLAHAFQNTLLVDQAFATSQGVYDKVLGDLAEHQSSAARKSLETAVLRCANSGLETNGNFMFGDAREVLSELAQRQPVDVTIVGSRGLDKLQLFFVGSVSSDVALNVDCGAVLVVKHRID